MHNFKAVAFALLTDDSGQDMVEYGLVAGLMGLGAIASLNRLAGYIGTELSTIGSTLTSST